MPRTRVAIGDSGHETDHAREDGDYLKARDGAVLLSGLPAQSYSSLSTNYVIHHAVPLGSSLRCFGSPCSR